MNIKSIQEAINKGEYAIYNRTRCYLAPSLQHYGEDFLRDLRQLAVTAFGVSDVQDHLDRAIYILANMSRSKIKDTSVFRKYVKAYIKDYPFGDIIYDPFHMLVLRAPLARAHDNFMEARYSRMYTPKQRVKFFMEGLSSHLWELKEYREAYDAMSRDKKLRLKRQEQFGVKLDEEDELDGIWNPEEEIFNYIKSK